MGGRIKAVNRRRKQHKRDVDVVYQRKDPEEGSSSPDALDAAKESNNLTLRSDCILEEQGLLWEVPRLWYPGSLFTVLDPDHS